MRAQAWSSLFATLKAYAADDFPAAAAHATQAAQEDPQSRLAAAAAIYLGRVVREGKAAVYVSGEAFGAFIRGGGNLPLYAALSAALHQAYQPAPLTLLDIGVGDGMALLPALRATLAHVDLVEPSAAMLGRTTAALTERGIAFRAFAMEIQRFIPMSAEHAPSVRPESRTVMPSSTSPNPKSPIQNGHAAHWDLAQATFSLQALPPAERREVLAWLGQHTPRLLIAEFDVPAFEQALDPVWAAHVAARYELGLAEYANDPTGPLVAQGFLLPVFFGYVDPGAARANYEQPIAAWEADLRAAGFRQVTSRPLYPYWWAPAYLIEAST